MNTICPTCGQSVAPEKPTGLYIADRDGTPIRIAETVLGVHIIKGRDLYEALFSPNRPISYAVAIQKGEAWARANGVRVVADGQNMNEQLARAREWS